MDVRRGAERAETRSERIVSRHSFAFGPHYEPGNLGFGVLVAHNEDLIEPAGGYPEHPHRDMEIVTWVLAGALEHRDSAGHSGIVVPGTVQRMSAGRGVRHSERSGEAAPLHMVQMWVRPDILGDTPAYGQADLGPELARGGLVLAASGRAGDESALSLRQPDARMFIAHLLPGASIQVPTAPLAHLFVARGGATLETDGASMPLGAGDAVRLTRSQGERLTAQRRSEIILWSLDS
ncbi:MAG: Pirin domain protein [Pseudonocardiales bacterium]|nr:Pirin domain protein [Jatrophihabitantaceae bacterium]MCW2602784.1 Pirin domain protein [Pseudonocardiales bacterium]